MLLKYQRMVNYGIMLGMTGALRYFIITVKLTLTNMKIQNTLFYPEFEISCERQLLKY